VLNSINTPNFASLHPFSPHSVLVMFHLFCPVHYQVARSLAI